MKKELLPCPFCGGEAELKSHPRNETFGYAAINRVTCLSCTASVSAEDPKDKNGWSTGSGAGLAVAAWNTRTAHAQAAELLAEVERYREVLAQIAYEEPLDPSFLAHATLRDTSAALKATSHD